MRQESRTTLTLRGRVVSMLASLGMLSAWLTAEPEARLAAALAAALLGGALLVDWLAKVQAERLVARPAPRQVEARQGFLEAIEIGNEGTRAIFDLRVAEPKTSTSAGGGHVPILAAGGRVTLTLPSRARERGRFEERVLVCDLVWPFALLHRRLKLRAPASLVVEPARIDLPQSLREVFDRREGVPSHEPRSGDAEFWMLREQAYGEDLRLTHALRSASTGTLVRRLYRGEEAPSVWIVLDLRRAQGSMKHGARRFEWSLSATATLCDELAVRGAKLSCLVLANEPKVFPVEDEAERCEFLAFLASAGPVEHRAVDLHAWPELHSAEVCLWIPAGGARASIERAALPDSTLVTIESTR